MIPLILLLLVVGLLTYIRLACSFDDRWHQPVTATEDKDLEGGAIRVLSGPADALARLDAAARALPRTTVLAGSVDQGRVTYVSRSKVFGFPDYTTIEQDGDTVRMFARLRFGRKDFGVNGARLRQLLQVLD